MYVASMYAVLPSGYLTEQADTLLENPAYAGLTCGDVILEPRMSVEADKFIIGVDLTLVQLAGLPAKSIAVYNYSGIQALLATSAWTLTEEG